MQKLKYSLLTLFILVITVLPVLAEDAEAVTRPQGIDLLMLLVGAGAIALVGIGAAARDMMNQNNDEQ